MASKEIFNKAGGCNDGNSLPGDNIYSKLILLRDCIRDNQQELETLRNFILNVENEIYVTNEKIKSCLDANQKRLDLLKELNNKYNLCNYKINCYIEEYMDLVPLNVVKEFYNNKVI